MNCKFGQYISLPIKIQLMKYWMKFDSLSISDNSFMGRQLNIPELKERFNTHFVKGSSNTCEISFLGNGVNKSFIAGFRNKSIVIIDKSSNKEYTPKEFSYELNTLESILNPKPSLLGDFK